MRIRFLNPVEQVTGSCYWLKDDEKDIEFLVDCGMMQGELGDREWNKRKFEFEPANLRCVFLTHTHIDHCGLLPRLVKEGFHGTVYCTRESEELAKIALADAAKQPGSLYTQKHVDQLKFHEPEGQLFGKLHPFGTDLFFSWYRTAHIAGGIAVQIKWGPKPTEADPDSQRSITFSGDLGCNVEGEEHLPLLRYRMRPYPADYAVVESTYGATLRSPEDQDFHARIARLKAAVDRAVFDRKGALLIPCFAIDRTQAVIFDLHFLFQSEPGRYADIPVFFNGPMAAQVNEVYAKALLRKEPTKSKGLKSLWLNKRLFEWLGIPNSPVGEAQLEAKLAAMLSNAEGNSLVTINRETNQVEGRKSPKPNPDCIYTTYARKPVKWVIDGQIAPAIVVTGGGMCDGGMILAYFESLLVKESTTLLFTGYLSPGTIGGKLLHLGKLSPEDRRRVSEHLEWPDMDPTKPAHRVPLSKVVAHMEQITGYSGHADQRGLIDWLFSTYNDKLYRAGRTIFVTHGQEPQRRALKAAIEAKSAEWAQLYAERHTGVTIHLPTKKDRWFDLDKGEWLAEDPDDHVGRLFGRVDGVERRLERMEEILLRIDATLTGSVGRPPPVLMSSSAVQSTEAPPSARGSSSPVVTNAALTEALLPPVEADWFTIAKFALTFDGYDYAGSSWECAEIATTVAATVRQGHIVDISLPDLRTALFFEQRRWHDGGYPDVDAMRDLHAIIAAIRERLARRVIEEKDE